MYTISLEFSTIFELIPAFFIFLNKKIIRVFAGNSGLFLTYHE